MLEIYIEEKKEKEKESNSNSDFSEDDNKTNSQSNKKLFAKGTITGGLFGNLSENSESDAEEFSEKNEHEEENSENEKEEKKANRKSLKIKKSSNKKTPIFSEKGENNPFANSALFSGSSLFANLNEKKEENKSSIFGNSLTNTINKSSLFSGSSLFGGSSLFSNEKKPEEEEEGEGEDEQKPGTPTQYDPNASSANSVYKKEFVKEMESFYELTKVEKVNEGENNSDKDKIFENKYLNKGRGFLSLEFTEEGGNNALVVYR